MTTFNVYLNFNGNCEDAFKFYQSVFGGEISYLGRFKEIPSQEGMPSLSAQDGEKIMHISLPISKETILLGSDIIGEHVSLFKQGNNFSISINTDSKNEADRLFNGLSVGGEVVMSMNQTFWDSYFGMLVDKFGINWMVSFDKKAS